MRPLPREQHLLLRQVSPVGPPGLQTAMTGAGKGAPNRPRETAGGIHGWRGERRCVSPWALVVANRMAPFLYPRR